MLPSGMRVYSQILPLIFLWKILLKIVEKHFKKKGKSRKNNIVLNIINMNDKRLLEKY